MPTALTHLTHYAPRAKHSG